MKPLWHSDCWNRLVSVWRQVPVRRTMSLVFLGLTMDLVPDVKVQWVPDTLLHPCFPVGSVILKTRSLNIFFLFQDVKSNDWVELEIWARQTQLENLFHLMFLMNVTRIIYHIYLKLYNFFIQPKKWMPFRTSFALPFVLMHENCTSNTK